MTAHISVPGKKQSKLSVNRCQRRDEGIRLTELEIQTIYISRPPCGKNAVKRLSGPSHG